MSNIERLEKQIEICVANGEKMIAKEKGLVKVTDINSGREINIKALVVPKLNFNLLSVKQLSNHEHTVIFTSEYAMIKNQKENFSMKCKPIGKLYIAEFTLPEVGCNVADMSSIWHKRLGHLRGQAMVKTEKNNNKYFDQ